MLAHPSSSSWPMHLIPELHNHCYSSHSPKAPPSQATLSCCAIPSSCCVPPSLDEICFSRFHSEEQSPMYEEDASFLENRDQTPGRIIKIHKILDLKTTTATIILKATKASPMLLKTPHVRFSYITVAFIQFNCYYYLLLQISLFSASHLSCRCYRK